ncbi:unnamed protein product, partial [Brugia timori]|uniref:Uncharacterized protein n=1 Tax=Brugia timori TaxID=42155 RepID=A0A0R3R6N8_9BILA
MINYYSCNNNTLKHLKSTKSSLQLKTSNVENFRDFLKLFPPVKQLIRMIPSFHKTNSSKGALHYNELFNNLLWWIAYNEQKNVPQVRISKVEITRVTQSRSNLSSTTYEDWEKHIRSILAAIKIDSPSILEAARDVELCLADSLEALGCHGLINCSEGLIRLLDAICLEVSNHQKRLKQVAKQLRNLKIDKSEFG